MATLVTVDAVKSAAARIAPYAHRTPVFRSASLDELVGAEVHLKAECLQKTGSFKIRGATNAVFSLSEEDAARGVVTHSSGNHGQALAAAAAFRGIPATVVAPRTTAQAKLDAIRGYGARVVLCEPTQEARVGTMESEAARMGGACIVPPYNDAAVIAGQGTIGLELLEQVPDLDAILVPTSGGGMLSGICVAAAGSGSVAGEPGSRPTARPRVLAVEPAGKRLGEALAAGQRVLDPESANQPLPTIVDAMPTQCLGPLCWQHVTALGDSAVYSVTDQQVREAMGYIYSRMKLVVEPAAATGVAALLDGQHQRGPGLIHAGDGVRPKIGVVLCGGNIHLPSLGQHFAHLASE